MPHITLRNNYFLFLKYTSQRRKFKMKFADFMGSILHVMNFDEVKFEYHVCKGYAELQELE